MIFKADRHVGSPNPFSIGLSPQFRDVIGIKGCRTLVSSGSNHNLVAILSLDGSTSKTLPTCAQFRSRRPFTTGLVVKVGVLATRPDLILASNQHCRRGVDISQAMLVQWFWQISVRNAFLSRQYQFCGVCKFASSYEATGDPEWRARLTST